MPKRRTYLFRSVWNIDASTARVWQTLTSMPFSWDEWWPELRDVRDVKARPGLAGSSFSCSWRSSQGYKLHTDVVIKEVEELQRVVLTTEGDLEGTVTCQISATTGGGTHIDIDWHVEVTKPWMNRLAPLLNPIFVHSHHAVMRSGRRGLRRHLAKTK